MGIPFESLLGHLKDKHGLKASVEEILERLGAGGHSMTLNEVQAWMANTWILPNAVEGIPAVAGIHCHRCHYSTKNKRVMTNHISKKHKGESLGEVTSEGIVQTVFKGRLKKYMLVQESEADSEPTRDVRNEWKAALEQDFNQSVDKGAIPADCTQEDLRLMGTFIAKIRWDLAIKDVDSGRLIELASVPTTKDTLYRVMLCARRYIHRVCERLSGGNMMVRRMLMKGRYRIGADGSDCRTEGEGKFFDALQEKASQNSYGQVLGRLVCFYIRLMALELEEEEGETVGWFQRHEVTGVWQISAACSWCRLWLRLRRWC